MDKVLTAVYVTSDYSKFKRLEYNRIVTEQRKNKLVASFSIHEIINPIVINKDFEIIDGQGRYEAKKELGLPICYVIDDNADIDDCRRMNEYNSKWTDLDYVKSFSKAGKNEYTILLNTCNETNLPIQSVLRLAGKSGDDSRNSIKNGGLKFTEENKKEVLKMAKYIKDIINAVDYTGRISENFRTCVRIMASNKDYDHNSFLNNCKKYKMRFTMMSRIEDQLKEFSKIYNINKSTGRKLYFEDYMRNRGANVRSYDEMKIQAQISQKDISTLESAV